MAPPALLLVACTAVFQEQGAYEETFPLDGRPKVEIRGLAGDLALRAAGESAFVARGTAFATGATRAAALDNLAEARLTGRLRDAELLAVFDPPLNLAGLVDLDLDRASDLPADVAVTARVDWGDIAVRGLRADIDLSTGGGRIRLEVDQRDLRIWCRPEGGAVVVDPALAATVQHGPDGSVLVTAGDQELARGVFLRSGGGDIRIDFF
jgi:hypothetical protein